MARAEGKAMRDNVFDADAPGVQRSQDGLEIPLLCPTHIAEWVILPALFILLIVAARAIGTRDLKGEFLLVEVIAPQIEADHTDKDDSASLAA